MASRVARSRLPAQPIRPFVFRIGSTNSSQAYVFDQASGVLLFYSGQNGQPLAPGQAGQLEQITLAGIRNLDIPWHGSAVPAWVNPGGGYLRYEGTSTTVMPGSQIPGVPSVPVPGVPYSALAQVDAVHGRWSTYKVTTAVGGMPGGTGDQVDGVTQLFGSYWLPPEALQAFASGAVKDGQMLDQDPVTGSQTTASVGGDGSLTLTESGRAYRSSLTYDPNRGMLTALRLEQLVGPAVVTVSLQLSDSR